ncbi:acyl-CoA dehydrogenase [Nocardioides kribbensis]|uniref:acyl-CoA dehydrogenase n=2 Tax=Nocardioides kribbensis TaxID=305517 RepID=UPI00187A8E92|nr:acyl-CoA dehydrogenase [Nocardioides kribbensis]
MTRSTTPSSTVMSRADLAFQLHEWLRVEDLLTRERYAEHSRDTLDAVLDLAETVATRHFATHNKRNDQEEPRFDGERVHLHPEVEEALAVYSASGFTGATFDEELGGLQLPQVVASAVAAWFQAANCGTAGYPFLTQANAHLLVAHGSPEQVERFVRPMLEGRFFGTMCLSEPQAGSSLADVTTTATEQPDGTFRLRGNKMWISGGDHEMGENIVHLVLARTAGAPAGVKGISLFLVPKHLVADDGSLGERNDVVLAGLNHKMGWRGTTNTLLNFGEGAHRPGGEPGAVGYLVGEQHRGLALMFHMMNEARVGVGLGAAALGCTGYLKALAYARERTQGRPVGAKDPASPPVRLVEHADVRRMLLTMKAWVEGGLGLVLYTARLVDEEQTAEGAAAREEAHRLLEVLTPIAKSWPSQWCLAANDLAIQVHGGYGYTREYDVEQHYRDNRLNPIHEGTHGIQGLDLLGRKVVAEGGAGLRLLARRIRETTDAAAARGGDLAQDAAAVQAAADRLVAVTATLWSAGDPRVSTANSSAYLEVAGHVVVAWLWLQQAMAADGDSDLHAGKRHAARWFVRCDLPRVHPQLDLLERLDRTVLDVEDAWL